MKATDGTWFHNLILHDVCGNLSTLEWVEEPHHFPFSPSPALIVFPICFSAFPTPFHIALFHIMQS